MRELVKTRAEAGKFSAYMADFIRQDVLTIEDVEQQRPELLERVVEYSR